MNLSIIFALIPLIKGQLSNLGKCPKVEPVKNFQPNNYTGRWYTILRYPNMFDRDYKCDRGEFSFSEDGKLHIIFTLLKTSDNTPFVLNLKGTLVKGCNIPEFDMEVRLDTGNIYVPTTVIATDYVNYNIFWACQQLGNYTLSYSWLYARNRTLSKKYLDEALTVYKKYGLNTDVLEIMDQTNCSN